ncbi:hypothetical protein AMIS_32410 [Actinoplanes missouriensis 431]|uniref:Uncharacterized protein n=1 Tax=Actinoplanes missouriensis (strain ATCC 14538 / DSM 43046 / CBS 188.64 / JCM 3121 / NBRC 102363 / NCIMB 12654 / NRRL B-3342 / UNCC 431) TaxID=512565 RepID=I0H624_ACTM4|nr:hypothetical protein AMIS_32410 [Actinoplanes missouriensis 431]
MSETAQPTDTQKSNNGADGHTPAPPVSDYGYPVALSWLSRCHDSLTSGHQPAGGRRFNDDLCWPTAAEFGSVVLEYAVRINDPHALDQAIDLLRRACHDGPQTGQARIANSYLLGMALCIRFDRCGRFADLNSAVRELQLAREVFGDAAERSDLARAGRALSLLGRAIHRRFRIAGQSVDLDEAAEAFRAAAELTGRRMTGAETARNTRRNARTTSRQTGRRYLHR